MSDDPALETAGDERSPLSAYQEDIEATLAAMMEMSVTARSVSNDLPAELPAHQVADFLGPADCADEKFLSTIGIGFVLPLGN